MLFPSPPSIQRKMSLRALRWYIKFKSYKEALRATAVAALHSLAAISLWIKIAFGLLSAAIALIQINEYLIAAFLISLSGLFLLIQVITWKGIPERRVLTGLAKGAFVLLAVFFVSFWIVILFRIKDDKPWSNLSPKRPEKTVIASPSPENNTTLSLQTDRLLYRARQYEALQFGVRVVLNSTRPTVVSDITLGLRFRFRGLDEWIGPDDEWKYFVVRGVGAVGPMDVRTATKELQLLLGCLTFGDYDVQLIAESQSLHLRAETTVTVELSRPLLPEERAFIPLVIRMSDPEDPTFQVTRGIVNVGSALEDGDRFKVILPDEAAVTNPLRATVWFQIEGSHINGFQLAIMRDSTPVCDIDTSYGLNEYVARVLESDETRTRVGEIGYAVWEVGEKAGEFSGSALVPIGRSFYRITKRGQQLQFSRVSPRCIDLERRLLQSPEDKFAVDARMEWELPSLRLSVKTGGYEGNHASTRIIQVGDKEYCHIEHYSMSRVESDFPVLIVLRDGVSSPQYPFLLLDLDDEDSLRAKKCQ